MSVFLKVKRPSLFDLASALESGRLPLPPSVESLGPYASADTRPELRDTLSSLHDAGMASAHVAIMLRHLAEERSATQAVADQVGLVWSGDEVIGATSRSTLVVAQELFREARKNVLIASYTLDQEEKANAIFGGLAQRMDDEPDLFVRLFVNVQRDYQDPTPADQIAREFANTFRTKIWPGARLPEVHYYPKALEHGAKRTCLHAKCIVIDSRKALITSANFTEAAHERNIEAGIVIESRLIAEALRQQFETLAQRGALVRLPGL